MLKIAAIIVGVLLAAIVLFVVYRFIATIRASIARDRRILEELVELVDHLERGEVPLETQIAEACQKPYRRTVVHDLLMDHGHALVFPDAYRSSTEHAMASLSTWMMHANEMGDPPEQIEMLTSVSRSRGDHDATYHVMRFRMPTGHWAAAGRWLLGVSGPYRPGEDPYIEPSFQFVRFGDFEASTDPEELVAWWEQMLERKGALPPVVVE
jgi:hypothetical protein